MLPVPDRKAHSPIGSSSMAKMSVRDTAPILCERALADIGELAGPLTHEVNDLLNNLALHLAVIQQVASQELSRELQEVRRQITHVAGVVARLQRRRRRQVDTEPLDINLALQHLRTRP